MTKPRQRAWRPAAARFAASRDAAAGVNGSDTVHRLGEPSGRTRRVGTVFGAGEHMALLPVRHMCMLICRISVWTQFCACSLRARTCTDPYRNFTCAVGDSLARSSNVLAATGHAVLGREAARLVLHVGRYVCGDAGPMALGTGTIRAHM